MNTLPQNSEADQLPTDFTTFLAERLRLTPEEAETKLADWLMHYVPLKQRQSSQAGESRSQSTVRAELHEHRPAA